MAGDNDVPEVRPTSDAAHFLLDGDYFAPCDSARGPWGVDSLNGSVISGLLAHEIERQHGSPELQPTRMTIDMHRRVPFAPVRVETRVVRDGRRIRAVDAELFSGHTSCARASCALLQRGEDPPGSFWSPPAWNAPHPESIPSPEVQDTLWFRPVSGGMGSGTQNRGWFRHDHRIVEHRELTPFVRAAAASDIASPFSLHGDQGLYFINTDITLSLHRLPRGPWLGFEVISAGASAGVAVGTCAIYDIEGRIGSVSTSALAQEAPAQTRRSTAPSRVET